MTFARILFQAYQSTNRSDYLNEANTKYCDLRKVAPPQLIRFDVGN
jgi:hypothetical protein